jgi:hypothetical protein
MHSNWQLGGCLQLRDDAVLVGVQLVTRTPVPLYPQVLSQLLPNATQPERLCLPEGSDSHTVLVRLPNATALQFLSAFRSPSAQPFINRLVGDLGAGCMSWISVRTMYCGDGLATPGALPSNFEPSMRFEPGLNTSTSFQYDYTNTPALDCPKKCVVTIALSNVSRSAGLRDVQTCNVYAGQVRTDPVSFPCPSAGKQCSAQHSMNSSSGVCGAFLCAGKAKVGCACMRGVLAWAAPQSSLPAVALSSHRRSPRP